MAHKKPTPASGPQLGLSQQNLEAATKELRAAQKCYQAAQQRLQLAEEGHLTAISTLNADMWAVKANTKVIPLLAQ